MSHDESNTYKVDERLYDHLLDSDDEDARAPVPQENLISAASYIATIIADSGIRCGVLGGLGVALNGISRETRDVDIGIVSANWRAIRKALDQHLDSGRYALYIGTR
jgi:predicted nucleotidyltransferase